MPGVTEILAGDDLLKDIQKWLSPLDPWKKINNDHKLRYGDTGAWLVKGETLSEWKASRSGPSSLLWISGKRQLPPGVHIFPRELTAFTFRSGRWQERPLVSESSHILVLRTYDVHSSTIIKEIETMQKSGHASLAVYYYDFKDKKNLKDLCGLLSSVIFQLSKQSDSYHPILSTFYSTHLDGTRAPSDDALIRCLMDLLKLPGSRQVYLIVDALDECPSTSSLSSPREELLLLLEKLVDAKFPNLRICVTSRPEFDINTILEPLAFRSVLLHDETGQQKDIRDYIESTVERNEDWSRDLKQVVIDDLTKKAHGM